MSVSKKLCLLCALAAVLAFAAYPAWAENGTDKLPAIAMQQSDLTISVKAVQTAGLVSALQSCGPFTVFAPIDCAWAKLSKPTVEELLSGCNKAMLTSILAYHAVKGNYSLCDLQNMKCPGILKTLGGGTLTITQKNGCVYVNNAKVIGDGIPAKNGMLFKIDMVLIPPGCRVQSQ